MVVKIYLLKIIIMLLFHAKVTQMAETAKVFDNFLVKERWQGWEKLL
jgi:hypothetical protein